MQITPLTVVKKQDNYQELAAFLDEDQYEMWTHSTDADILKLNKPLNERQQLLLSVWLSVYSYDYKDEVIG